MNSLKIFLSDFTIIVVSKYCSILYIPVCLVVLRFLHTGINFIQDLRYFESSDEPIYLLPNIAYIYNNYIDYNGKNLLSFCLAIFDVVVVVLDDSILYPLLLVSSTSLFLFIVYRDFIVAFSWTNAFVSLKVRGEEVNEDAPVAKKSVYELKEDISEELKQMQNRIQEQVERVQEKVEESKQIQIQQCHKQSQDFRKCLMDVQTAIDNQTKQQSLVQNLILDLKNSKNGHNPDNLESEMKKCVICLDEHLSVALIPCGHMIACKKCAKKLPHVCPICRGAITDTLKIYFP